MAGRSPKHSKRSTGLGKKLGQNQTSVVGIESLMSAAHAAGYAMAPSEGLDRGATVGLEPAPDLADVRTADWEAVDAEAALRAEKAGPKRSRALVPVKPGATSTSDWLGLSVIGHWFGGRATA